MQLALQTIAVALTQAAHEKTALIVTTLPVQSLLPKLRQVLAEQLSRTGGAVDLGSQVKERLSLVSISRIFDLHGLVEVLGELSLRQGGGGGTPDAVLVMGTAALINSLFASKSTDKAAAHGFVANLAVQLDRVASGGPLVILLNSATALHNDGVPLPPAAETGGGERKLEVGGLTSIFWTGGAGQQHGRKTDSRPAWGQVFGRLVEVHLFCTRRDVGWVVEVLGDEVGVFEREADEKGEGEVWTRRNREQRWGVLEGGQGGVVVDVVM